MHLNYLARVQDQPVLKAKEANIYKLEDCITKGYPIMFTLSDDNQELIGGDPQPTGYDKTDYGMLYFAAAGMERKGNVLSFPMQGLVILDGGKWEYCIRIHGNVGDAGRVLIILAIR